MLPTAAAEKNKKKQGNKVLKNQISLNFQTNFLTFSRAFYLVSDSYSRPQTRESVESTKNWLEYESFEYESRLDPSLALAAAAPAKLPTHRIKASNKCRGITCDSQESLAFISTQPPRASAALSTKKNFAPPGARLRGLAVSILTSSGRPPGSPSPRSTSRLLLTSVSPSRSRSGLIGSKCTISMKKIHLAQDPSDICHLGPFSLWTCPSGLSVFSPLLRSQNRLGIAINPPT